MEFIKIESVLYSLATCVGVGLGIAAIIENINL
jgi:hypothetical protein